MSLPGFAPEPLRVVCDSCGTEGFTFDYQRPDRAVECPCCPLPHDHGASADATGVICRPVTIFGTAHLRMFEVADLMDAADPALLPVPDENAEVTP